MILFPDSDGVLHPQYEDQPVPADVAFCHLVRFEVVLRDFPKVSLRSRMRLLLSRGMDFFS